MRIALKVLTALCFLIVSIVTTSAQTPQASVRQILDSPQFKTATAFIERDHDRFVRELIALTEVPAPPFKEKKRGDAFLGLMRQHSLSDVEIDAEGNVMGVRKGNGTGPMLAVLAHMDTVFPEGTDVTVKRDGTKYSAPGIGDNTRGLALMLALVRAMDAAKFQAASDILFVGNVGEEGEGDLRGTKFVFQKGKYKDRIRNFIAIDGGDQSTITTGGVGSRRYRVTFKGPGGHSYSAFGLVNPAFAMGDAIARFSRVQVPQEPKTTYSVGVVRGGTSINAIPFEVSMDVDMRSESCAALKKVEDQFLAIVRHAADAENKARSTKEGKIVADPKLIGDRPCGRTAESTPLVQTVAAAVSAFGLKPEFETSSTDANLPMNLGIPAVTIGRGPSFRSHSLDEYTVIDPKADAQAAQVALTIILAAAGLK
ncbi:MAG: M20/M25/M40 family metallo-hydrolase [Acidobacteria bacterium]|nr:M20/M25/M40 family metallo-hydrolase [Acidobacteriota bacterium]